MTTTLSVRPPHSGLSPLATQLRETVGVWSRSQYELVVLAAEFADSGEWVFDGAPTAASWIAVGSDPGGSKPSPPFGAERRNASP